MTAQRTIEAGRPMGLADRLWAETEALHRQAERSGVFRDLLRGDADRASYALLLRNLLPVYQALEHGLETHRRSPALAPLARRDLFRADAIAADLRALGAGDLTILTSASRYAERVRAATERDGSRLIAHAYVRYLGDLNGGQILKRLLARHLGLGADQLTVYDFPGDPDALARDYRAAVDVAGATVADPDAVLAEASEAFRLNIALSEEVGAPRGETPRPTHSVEHL